MVSLSFFTAAGAPAGSLLDSAGGLEVVEGAKGGEVSRRRMRWHGKVASVVVVAMARQGTEYGGD